MKSMSRFLFVMLAILSASQSVRANTDPPTWLDVQNYGADPTCVSDSGSALNSAIAAVSSTSAGAVIFFPTGCYLIKTQIVDAAFTGGGITYLGFGRVELSAGTGLSGSILKLGDNSNTVTRRRLSNLYFECNALSGIDGIQVVGLMNSQFDDIEIRNCSSYAMRTTGSNGNVNSNVFEAGGVYTTSASANGIFLGLGAHNWTFKGTRLVNATTGTPSGIGLEIEGSAGACFGCDIAGWSVGLAGSIANLGQTADGLEVSGSYFENNISSHIRVGQASVVGAIVHGAAIHGSYFFTKTGVSNTACIDIEQADGFTVQGNRFSNCGSYNVYAFADGTNQGGDNGIVANNSVTGSATTTLLGSNITLISSGQITQINSTSNCSSTANPASCSSYANGSVTIPAGSTSITVDTTAVTAKSQILVTFDSSLGAKLGITCNTTFAAPFVSARTAGTSFAIKVTSAPSTNPACFSYSIIN